MPHFSPASSSRPFSRARSWPKTTAGRGDTAGICLAAFTFPVLPGEHPHDVAPAADDRHIWYTAQQAGALGLLDPVSGAIETIPLGEGSSPHGVVVAPDGAAWVTDTGLNAIVRVDADTRELSVWPLAGPNVNLNTATIDPDGVVLVHRSEWHRGSPRSVQHAIRERSLAGRRPARARPVRDRRHAGRRRLLRLAGRELSGEDRAGGRRELHSEGDRAADGRAGDAPRLVGFPGCALDQRVERRSGSAATIPRPVSGRSGAFQARRPGLRGLRRRAGRRLVERFRGQRTRALRPGDGDLRRRAAARYERAGPPIARSSRRGLGRRVRRRRAGRRRSIVARSPRGFEP